METKRGRFKFRFKKEQIVRALIILFKFQVMIIEFICYFEILSKGLFIDNLVIEQNIFPLLQSASFIVESLLVSS